MHSDGTARPYTTIIGMRSHVLSVMAGPHPYVHNYRISANEDLLRMTVHHHVTNVPLHSSHPRPVERALNLNGIIIIQPINFKNRPRRIPTRILTPKLDLYFVAHGSVPIHIGHIHNEAGTICQFDAGQLDEITHVLVCFADAGQAGWCKGAVLLVDAAHAWVRVSMAVKSCYSDAGHCVPEM